MYEQYFIIGIELVIHFFLLRNFGIWNKSNFYKEHIGKL